MRLLTLFALIFFVTACSPPEPGTDEWYEEKYNEFIETIPNADLTFEDFKAILENPVYEEDNLNENDKIVNDTEKNMTLVTIQTSLGEIKLELNNEKAPLTVENFKTIAASGYYEGTIFHRVINGFMVQGGGLTADMNNKSSGTSPIQNEANNGLSNDRGTIAMARTGDPHSATSQFFINHKDNSFLNHSSETMRGWGYAVFGKVTDGMDVVDAIAVVDTGNFQQYADVPVEPIMIQSISVME